MTARTEHPGPFPRPGIIGRAVRLFFGVLLIYFFVETFTSYSSYVAVGAPGGTWWLGAAISFYLLPEVTDVGFGLSWGRKSQMVALALALGAMVFDFFWYGNLWGPPLGLLVYLLMGVVLGYLGLSFVLAAIFGVPGCELRAVPYVIGKLSGREAAEHY